MSLKARMGDWKVKIATGVGVVLVGALLVPALLLTPVADMPDEEIRFLAPGDATLEAAAQGRFYLWHEYRSRFDGRRYETGDHLPAGTVIEARQGDRSLDAVPADNVRTEFGDSASVSVARLDVPAAGPVSVSVRYGDGRPRVFSLSRFTLGAWARAIGLSVLSMLIAGASGLALLIAGIAQRVQRDA
ncbi:MAG: hypothetical protein ACNS61_04690 [Candidatus Wenzhouxiangella sp. M2_3B_020]